MKTHFSNGTVAMPLSNVTWGWQDEWDEMYPEIEKLITSLATSYVDTSNPMLHLDELQAECRAKLGRVAAQGKLDALPSRAKFFAFLKVLFRNHISSQVTKHVFTEKRGGSGTRFNYTHVTLNDPDAPVQIAQASEEPSMQELAEDFRRFLSSDELLVLERIISADQEDERSFVHTHTDYSSIRAKAAVYWHRRTS
ncbi:MAG: hypothetical protein ACK4UN_00930 [Limisphaerales bacterium]